MPFTPVKAQSWQRSSLSARSSTLLPALLLLASLASSSQAQINVNGQIYTNGLAIVDAPQPLSQYNNPGNIAIAIDVSGNGALAASASNPNSTSDATGFQLMEIFLISKDLGLNLTVSSGPGLLNVEVGSTVKHVDFKVPGCVSTGNWNVTFHETSRINGTFHYTVTPFPITVKSNVVDSSASSCSNITNPLLDQPLADAALPSNPWGNNGSTFGQPVAVSSVERGVGRRSFTSFLPFALLGGVSAALSLM